MSRAERHNNNKVKWDARARRRLNEIFAGIARGKTADTIREGLARGEERGAASQQRVIAVLRGEPIVEKITETGPGSRLDRQGKDLKVDISGRGFQNFFKRSPKIKYVWVQVKSSQRGVGYFRAGFGMSEDQIKQNLVREGIVVLDGSQREEEIIGSFIGQLDYIEKNRLSSPVEVKRV